DFLDDPAITVSGSPGGGPYSATITCPANTPTGLKRMRIRIHYNNETTSPCGINVYGEVEDYSVNVLPLCTPPSAPIVGTITQPTCILATGSVQLNGLPSSGSWTLTMSPGAVTTTGTGVTTSISGLSSGTYSFTVTNSASCTSLASANAVINTQPATPAAPTGASAQAICSIISPTIASLTATGTAIQWYAAASGGSALAANIALISGNHYYASQTVGNCESTSRLDVTVTLTAAPSAPTGDTSQTFCNGATIANLIVSGSNIKWYDASIGGNLLLSTTLLVNGTTYYASQTTNGCESQSRFGVTVISQSTIITITRPISSITFTGATLNGELASACANTSVLRGFVYAAHSNPSLSDLLSTKVSSGTGLGVYSSTLSSLASNVYYWERAYAINGSDTTYGAIYSFQTSIWPFFNLELRNDVQVSPTEYQFDVYITHTGNYTTPVNFEMSGFQLGIYINDAIRNGGVFTDSIVPGSNSGLSIYQQIITPSISNSTPNKCFKIIGQISQSGQGTIISHTGTKLMRLRLINSVPFAQAKPNLVFTAYDGAGFNYATKINARINAVSTNISGPTGGIYNQTNITSSLNNPTLNILTQYNLSGGGVICGNGATVSVSLSGSQSWLNYQLLKDGVSYGPIVAGTGNPISWNLTVPGTYTCRSGINNMNGSATVTISNPSAPSGNAIQSFSYAATVANLVVTGSNIKWYNAPTGGNLLLPTISLVNGTTYYASQTLAGCESNNRFGVTVSMFKTVNLHLFLEGLFDHNSNNSMVEAQEMDWGMGIVFAKYGAGIADRIQVELFSGNPPFTSPVVSISGIDLSTTGLASFQISPSWNGNYYIRVISRNHLEVWSANAISFSAPIVDYNFISSAINAYQAPGGNDPQAQMNSGVYAFYLGDLDQSLSVDFDDFNIFEPYLNDGIYGFTIADFNGNGLVDFDDFNLFEPRLNEGPFSQYPGMP
ncbi:MAG: GEVED domain-containing protein, partial [Bacteroidota bacterium]